MKCSTFQREIFMDRNRSDSRYSCLYKTG